MKGAENQSRLTAMLFIAVAATSLGAPQVYLLATGATLILSTHGADAIAVVYMIAAALILPLGWSVRRLSDLTSPIDVLIAAIAFRALVAFSLFVSTFFLEPGLVAYAVAVWARVDLIIGLLALWRVASRVFADGADRRWLGWIAACDPISTLVAGVAAPIAASFIGVEAMLVAAGLTIAAAAPPAWALRAGLDDEKGRRKQRRPRASAEQTRRPLSPKLRGYVWVVAVAMALWTMAHYLVDALFYGLAARALESPETVFNAFSWILAASGLLGVVIVWGNEGRLVRRFGPRLLLVITPTAMLTLLFLGVVGVSVFGVGAALFFAVAAMKTIEYALVSGFYTRSWRAFFAPMPESHRRRLVAGIEVAVHGVGAGLAAIAFLALAGTLGWSGVEIAMACAALIGLGMLISIFVQRGYDQALERAFLRRQAFDHVDIGASDRKSREIIQKMLRAGDKGDAIQAARLQAALDVEGFATIAPRLIARGDKDVVKTLLDTVREVARPDLYPPMAGRLTIEEDEGLRDSLLTAAAATGHPRSPRLLARAIAEAPENPPIGALVGMGRHGGPYGSSVAAQFLERQALKGDAALARTLDASAKIGVGAPAGPIALALRSNDPAMRRKAIRAAGKIADGSLAPLLVEHLADPRERRAATVALSTMGAGAVEALARTIGDRNLPLRQRIAATRALGGVDDIDAREQLSLHAESRDREIRAHAHLALWRAGAVAPRDKTALFLDMATEELRSAAEMTIAAKDLSALGHRSLQDTLRQRARRAAVCAIRAAGLTRPRDRHIEVKLSALFGQTRDWRYGSEGVTLLPEALRTLFRDVTDPDRPEAEARLRKAIGAPEPRAPEDWLGHILTDARWTSDWLRAVAYDQLARTTPADAAEIADLALSGGAAAGAHLNRAFADHTAGDKGEDAVALSIVEKVLILKSADLFENVPDEDLAEIAPFLTPIYLDPGETIITEGEMGDELYIVVSGEVQVVRGGEELVRRGERAVFGDLAALDPEPRSASVIATQPTQVLALSNEHLLALFEANVEISAGVISTLIQRLRNAESY